MSNYKILKLLKKNFKPYGRSMSKKSRQIKLIGLNMKVVSNLEKNIEAYQIIIIRLFLKITKI